jgi:hypothetical protein
MAGLSGEQVRLWQESGWFDRCIVWFAVTDAPQQAQAFAEFEQVLAERCVVQQ